MKRLLLFLCVPLSLCANLYGWGNKKTHPALTEKAIERAVLNNYLKTQFDLIDGTATELTWDFPADIRDRIKWGEAEPDKTNRTALEWIRVGSTIEDEDGRWQPIRARHHFHDPTRNAGLDNNMNKCLRPQMVSGH